MTRVALVDDHEVVRDGVRALLDEEPDLEVIGEAATAAAALDLLTTVEIDVALLDLNLPDGSGIDVCRAARDLAPNLRVLILTSSGDDEALQAAIVAGADGFVLKHVRAPQLVEAIRAVASGRSLLDDRTRARVVERLRSGHARRDPDGLSGQELRLLELLADGLTNRQLAERLGLAEKTVKNYLSSLLAKLGVARRTEAVVLAVHRAEQERRDVVPQGPAIRY